MLCDRARERAGETPAAVGISILTVPPRRPTLTAGLGVRLGCVLPHVLLAISARPLAVSSRYSRSVCPSLNGAVLSKGNGSQAEELVEGAWRIEHRSRAGWHGT